MIDIEYIFDILLSQLWWLLPLLCCFALFQTSPVKSWLGEIWIQLACSLFLDKNDYKLIKKVSLPTAAGDREIDFIIVSSFGLFLIQTSHKKGWIFGNADQKEWTQKTAGYKQRFDNPLHQTDLYKKELEELLGLESDRVFSAVLFVCDSKFITEMPENVLHCSGFTHFIKSKTRRLLLSSEVENIVQQIEAGRLTPSFRTLSLHARQLEQLVADKLAEENESLKRCPDCGRMMELRITTEGPKAGSQYWGCSAFPKCRKVTALDEQQLPSLITQ